MSPEAALRPAAKDNKPRPPPRHRHRHALFAAVVDGPGDLALQIPARWTIRSMKPCSSRNRWSETLGQLDADVVWIVRGPAKPIRAFGLGEDDVAQRGEAGGDAAHRRVGQDAR